MMIQMEQRVHARNLVEWAKDRPKYVVVSADLTGSCEISEFKATYPERFFSMGLTEQHAMSFCAGLAREGFYPMFHTFAVFMYRRALDQIEMSVSYPNLNVRIMGFLPGVTTPGGATHQAINDIGVLRTVPNMTILEVGDATDIESVLDVSDEIDGPVYIRMLRGEVPRIFTKDNPMRFNKARILNEGTDITILTSGICTKEALDVLEVFNKKGVSIELLHVSTLKPFTDPQISESISKAKYGVITMDNHSIYGGLGTSVAERIAKDGLNKKLISIGLEDQYLHGSSREYLMREFEIDSIGLIKRVELMLDQKLGLTKEDLLNSDAYTYFSEEQLDAL